MRLQERHQLNILIDEVAMIIKIIKRKMAQYQKIIIFKFTKYLSQIYQNSLKSINSKIYLVLMHPIKLQILLAD